MWEVTFANLQVAGVYAHLPCMLAQQDRAGRDLLHDTGRLGWRSHPTPYTLHPTPYTRHPAPYTRQPTPFTLNLTPYTPHLHLAPFTCTITAWAPR